MKNKVLAMLAFMVVFTACEKDEDEVTQPVDDHEEELITTVQLTFVGPDQGQMISQFRFADPDGEGGNAPTEHDTIVLQAGASYTASIEFFNESETPIEDVTEEIEEEADGHLVCYDATVSDLTITKDDSDGTYPIGLATTWAHTGSAGTGAVTVTLKHQPGEKDGTCAPGETDVEVTFVLRYE